MKLHIGTTIQDEVEPAIEDSLANAERGSPQQTDSVYLKIHAAIDARKGVGTVVIDATPDEVAELVDRAKYQLECVIPDNLPCSDPYDWAYWLGRRRAYKAFLEQVKRRGL